MCKYSQVRFHLAHFDSLIRRTHFFAFTNSRDVLKDGGSAADAAIAALICEGVTCPQSTGLGGGFVLTIYTKATSQVETLIAKDAAPAAVTVDMFGNATEVTGAKSITVPGELKGYWELYKKYGKLPWARLFAPTIELCRNGHVVSDYLERTLKNVKHLLINTPLADIFINPQTNDTYKKGDLIRRLTLANTLEMIAKEGPDTLYKNGTLANQLIGDIRENDGIMTLKDLMDYQGRWERPLTTTLAGDRRLYTVTAPGSGSLIVFMMNVLKEYLPGDTVVSYARIAEVFKYAYAQRSHLADPEYVKEVLEVREQ